MQFTQILYKLLIKHIIRMFAVAVISLNISVYFYANESLKKQASAQSEYVHQFHSRQLPFDELYALTSNVLAIKVYEKNGTLVDQLLFKKSWDSTETLFSYPKFDVSITHKTIISAHISSLIMLNFTVFIILLLMLGMSHVNIYRHWKFLIQLELWAVKFSRNRKYKFYIKNQDYLLVNAIRELNKERNEARKGGQKADHFIRSQTFLDKSTNLGNRLYFEHRLDSILLQEDKVYGAVMIINYGALQLVLDKGSHKELDELLIQFSDILKVYVDDTMQSILSRISTTEFALLLPLADGKEVEKIAINVLRMSLKLRLPEYIDPNTLCHIGVDMYDRENTSFQIMAEADMALRAAQLHGPSGWFMYDSGELPASEIKGSVRWRSTIQSALEQNSFNLCYQPVVNSQLQIHHHEVLARIIDNRREQISAKLFLPMAKKCGLIPEIDKKILALVMTALKKSSDSPISVNIHVDSWMNRGFCNWLLKFLKQHTDLNHKLIFEVSEYELAQHAQELTSVFAAIRRFNIQLMVDQVGLYVLETSYLDYIQVEYLKLHQSIVHRINETPENQMFIRSLQTVANEKNILIFAMGVESEQELQTLNRMGINGMQGHYVKSPVAEVLAAKKEVVIDGDILSP